MEDKELVERLEARNKAYIEFLTELNNDRKKDSTFLKVILSVLAFAVVLCVCGFVYLGIRTSDRIEAMAVESEKRMYEFISEYDFATAYNLDTGTIVGSDASGNINFNQR